MIGEDRDARFWIFVGLIVFCFVGFATLTVWTLHETAKDVDTFVECMDRTDGDTWRCLAGDGDGP